MAEHKKRKKKMKCGRQDHEHDESCMMEEGAPVHDYDLEEKERRGKKKK